MDNDLCLDRKYEKGLLITSVPTVKYVPIPEKWYHIIRNNLRLRWMPSIVHFKNRDFQTELKPMYFSIVRRDYLFTYMLKQKLTILCENLGVTTVIKSLDIHLMTCVRSSMTVLVRSSNSKLGYALMRESSPDLQHKGLKNQIYPLKGEGLL